LLAVIRNRAASHLVSGIFAALEHRLDRDGELLAALLLVALIDARTVSLAL
jgi:hypothetical protein